MRALDAIELFRICAADTDNSEAWSEFLRRYSVKIRYFIRGTLKQHAASYVHMTALLEGAQESDLFQNFILRLVSNECAAMKRFSGRDENDLLAYLAVISRSTVLDMLRTGTAGKRVVGRGTGAETEVVPFMQRQAVSYDEFDRRILLRELASFTRDTADSESEHTVLRDRLVFDLHFFHGLSSVQISRCEGINLTSAGVDKLLKRIITRVQNLATKGKLSERLV
jgi:RNA polymerase sigma factor (sigma-70 family)